MERESPASFARGAVKRSRVRTHAAAAVLVASLALPSPAAGRSGPHVEGDELSFSLHDLEGQVVGSDDERFRGKVVFVDIFGTWCTPCLSEIPTLKHLHAKYSGDGLVVVAIAFEHGDDPAERRNFLRWFTESNGIAYLVLDGGTLGTFSRSLPGIRNVKGFPIEVFIDRDGRVVDTRNGYGDKGRWSRELEARLVEMLAKPATVKDAPAAAGSQPAE